MRHFGVPNHKPLQIELLKTAMEQPLLANQLQFSLAVANMVANGLEVNMDTDGACDRDGSVLDYSRKASETASLSVAVPVFTLTTSAPRSRMR